MKLVDVLILAGGRNKGPLREVVAIEHEALIEIGKLPMVEYVIRAVKKAQRTGKVVIVGPKKRLEERLQEKVDLIIDSSDSMLDNIKRGIEVLDKNRLTLIVSCDIPLITSEMIDEFLATCLGDEEADIYYPIIPKEENQARFPESKRTYVHLAEGTFTGGNMVVIKPSILDGALDLLEKAIKWRKKPWKMSKLLGVKVIFKFVIGNLSIEEIEKRVNKITGYKGKGLISPYPEIGFDVDKPSDLKLMEERYIN